MKKFFKLFILTGFFIGYSPFFPGTLASLLGLFFIIFLIKNKILYLIIFLLATIFCLLFSNWGEKFFNKKDPKQIVIDEIAGMFISFFYLPSYNIKTYIIGFFLFRLLDILKPTPIKYLEKMESGIGIILDDLIAGIFTNILLRLIYKIFQI
jgi:phosphatidylglycerophosphatase A